MKRVQIPENIRRVLAALCAASKVIAENRSLMVLAALLLAMPLVSCDQVLGLDPVTLTTVNAYICNCTCAVPQSKPFLVSDGVCMPKFIDQNIGGRAPTQFDLDNDCAGRVQDNLNAIVEHCESAPIACSCRAQALATTFTDESCDLPCTGQDLAGDCSNFNPFATPPVKTATNFQGLLPVCVVTNSDPPDPVANPLTSNLLGRSSECDVTGNVTASRGGDSQTHSANGIVNITGSPCPGGTCQVGVSYRTDHIDDFSFSSFGGFDSVVFQNLFAIGASIPAGATVDATGNGAFQPNTTQSFGKGHRSNQILGVEVGSKNGGFTGSNGNPLAVGVDWQNHTCSLSGAIFGQIESANTNITADLAGTIVNEPPTANAGGAQTVECTSPA